MKHDLTVYGDTELCNVVLNTEYLYLMMEDTDELIEVLDQMYEYTEEQMEELMESISDYFE